MIRQGIAPFRCSYQFMRIHSKLLSQRDTADFLGISISTLFRLRQNKILHPGIHYRRKFPRNQNSPLLFDAERCIKTLNEAEARDIRLMEQII